MDKATSNHAFCSTDTPTSVSLSCAFVLFVVEYSLRPFVCIGVHWCAFVVQTIPCHRHFVPFVYFVLFVVKYSLRLFVASKDHSAIKKQTGHPRKIIKKVYISSCYSKTSFPYGTSWSP